MPLPDWLVDEGYPGNVAPEDIIPRGWVAILDIKAGIIPKGRVAVGDTFLQSWQTFLTVDSVSTYCPEDSDTVFGNTYENRIKTWADSYGGIGGIKFKIFRHLSSPAWKGEFYSTRKAYKPHPELSKQLPLP